MKNILKLLIVVILTLLLFRPQYQFYQQVYYGKYEVYIENEYKMTINKYTTYYENGNKYYCIMPNSVLNSQEDTRIMFCFTSNKVELKQIGR